MSTTTITRRKKRWPFVIGGIFLLLLALYFVATSGAFVRGVILPRVAASLNSDLTVDDLSLSPFSSVEIHGLKLTPKGRETLVSAALVRARYSLMAILKGDIKVSEVTIESPEVDLVVRPDGTSNLDALFKSLSGPAPAKASSGAPAKAPKLEIQNVALRNASFHMSQTQTNGHTAKTEITGLNLTIDSLQNPGASKLSVNAKIALSQPDGATLAAALSGNLGFALDAKLLPSSVTGGFKLDVSQATGAFKDVADSSVALSADVTPTEIKQLELTLTRGGQPFGRVKLSGPFDLNTQEARVSYDISGIDRRALLLAMAGQAPNLGDMKLSATGRVDLAQQGRLIASRGKWSINQLSLVTTNGTTPSIDFSVDYQTTVNLTDKTALLEKLDLQAQKGKSNLLSGSLERPMNIAFGGDVAGFRASTYTLKILNFDLNEWKAVFGQSVPGALVGAVLTITADNNGRSFKGSLDSTVDRLTIRAGPADLHDAKIALKTDFTLEDFKDLGVRKYSVSLSQQGQTVVQLNGSASYQLKTGRAGAQATIETSLPAVLRIAPVAGLRADSGTLRLSVQFDQESVNTNVSLTLNLASFTGAYNQFEFHDYQASLNLVAAAIPGAIDLSRFTVAAQTGFNSGGSLDVSGKYNTSKNSATADFKTVNLNENAIGPFVAAFVKPNQLVSVSLDANGNVSWAASGESSLRADANITRLLAKGPAGPVTEKPIEMGFSADCGQKSGQLDIKKFLIKLGATPKAKNELLIAGHFDLGTNQASPSSLNIKSDGLDLTPLADLFAPPASSNTPPARAANPAAAAASKSPPQEPPPVSLPFKRLDAGLDIAHLYLRQVEIENWKGQAKIDNGVVTLDPFTLTLNGSPVTLKSEANLAVQGYKYKTSATANRIPLAPLVDSFIADMKGTASGFASINADISSAGVTPPSIRKTLAGTVVVNTTNLTVQIPKTKVHLPFLGETDMTGPLSFVAAILGMGDVLAEPIHVLQVSAVAKNGKIDLAGTKVASAAFRIEPTGGIMLADIITNSPVKVPLAFYLGPNGTKAMLLKAGADGYGRLPDFASVVGTVGHPDTHMDRTALAGLVLRGMAGIPGGVGGGAANLLKNVGGKTGSALGGLENLLAPSTPGATNQSPSAVGGLLKALGGAATNSPANTNKQQTPFNPLDLLRGK